MGNKVERKRIEQRIQTLAKQITWQRDSPSWLDQEEIEDFIFAWHDLASYYKDDVDGPVDDDIGVGMLELFADFSRAFVNVKYGGEVDPYYREKAGAMLRGIEYAADEIIRIVAGNLRNTEE